MSSRRREVMSRVLRGGTKDDGFFDREFWRRVGAAGILEAAWEMVAEIEAMRGGNVGCDWSRQVTPRWS